MKNLTPAQQRAFARVYRSHHTRLYRSPQHPDGTYTITATDDFHEEVGQATIHRCGDAITIDLFNADKSPYFTTRTQFKACIVATLLAYQHDGRPLADAFEIACEPTVTSLPMLTPEVITAV